MRVLRFFPLCVLALVTTLSLAQSASPSGAASSNSKPSEGFSIDNIDKSVDPCSDFYQYACGGWIKKNPIPPDQARWNVYSKLANENQKTFEEVLKHTTEQFQLGEISGLDLRRLIEAGVGCPISMTYAIVPAMRAQSEVAAEWEPLLTSREYDLLVFLMRNPRKAFTRDQLLTEVWSWTFGDTSTVTVHVRRLREKLEPDPTMPRRIVTVWGVGYRYEPEAA